MIIAINKQATRQRQLKNESLCLITNYTLQECIIRKLPGSSVGAVQSRVATPFAEKKIVRLRSCHAHPRYSEGRITIPATTHLTPSVAQLASQPRASTQYKMAQLLTTENQQLCLSYWCTQPRCNRVWHLGWVWPRINLLVLALRRAITCERDRPNSQEEMSQCGVWLSLSKKMMVYRFDL